VYVEHVKC